MATARVALLQLPAYSIERAAESLTHTLQRIDSAAAGAPGLDLIVLPEGTYPAYFLGADGGVPDAPAPAEAADRIAARARAHGVYIAAGLAVESGGGRYANAAMLFDRTGNVTGRYDKSFLWHFDRKWFAPGAAYPVFETDFGRLGMLVCADGRMPEIARCLALNGAQLIVDLTAWVSGGRRGDALTTSQFEYLMRVRAAENGVAVVCADKWGAEAESIVYAGRSCVIAPDGVVAAALGPTEDADLVCDVPLADARPPVMRRPELYGALAEPAGGAGAAAHAADLRPVRIAVAQVSMPPDGDGFVHLARRHLARQALMDTDLLVFPATPSRFRSAYDRGAVLAGIRAASAVTGVLTTCVVWDPDGDGYRTLYLVGPEGVIASHRQSHKPPGGRFASMPLGNGPSPVVETPVGRVGLMLAAELAVPEVARSLMLRGAEVIICASDAPGLPITPFARTRAEENRVFFAVASAPGPSGAGLVVDPGGRLLAEALEGAELAVGADVIPALARSKRRAPGTDVVADRQPETYGVLAAQTAAAAR